MATKESDLALYLGAQAVSLAVAVAGYLTAPLRWRWMAVATPILLATLIVKALRPDHAIIEKATWPYMLITVGLVELALFFLGDHSILGYWTVPASIGLGFLYCLVHMSLGPGDDVPPPKR